MSRTLSNRGWRTRRGAPERVDAAAESSLVADVATARRPDDRLNHRRVRGERWLTRGAILVTLVAFGNFLLVYGTSADARVRGPLDLLEAAAFLVIVALLVWGGFVYLLARLGYMRRRSRFRHASRHELQQFMRDSAACVSILVPSYKEELHVVRHALLSAALQEYPDRRVVLLIDDPPNPSTNDEREALEAMRGLPAQVQQLLEVAGEPLSSALRAAEGRALTGCLDREQETARLVQLYRYVVEWFARRAESERVESHSDGLFVELCLREPANRHAMTVADLARRLRDGGPYPRPDELLSHYRRLAAIFKAPLASFERKRYASLSHAPNKAMNLNSYIALMGRRLAVRRVGEDLELHDAPAGPADLAVPDADYILTLDADSLLEPSYATRLVHFLEQPANARVAVAQTPYSAVPGAPRGTERTAGATTDIQYIIHQGFTAHGATYWVGANAVIRKKALEDIASTVGDERTARSHTQYIRDRTVIEDTESTVDLVAQGWQLFNYPARLSYSATPPDFGSLVVQRHRWANGGLLILPKLLRLLPRRPVPERGPFHGFMRVHYLLSIAAVNFGLVVLFLVPFEGWHANAWLPLTTVPYFVLYMHDLRLAGYRRREIFKVYALNLLLVPVNLGGVTKSIHQAFTGRGAPFRRTPKVKDRTSAPLSYIVLPCVLALFLIIASAWSLAAGSPLRAVAAGVNGGLLVYAMGAFVGWRHGWEDLAAQARLPWRRGAASDLREPAGELVGRRGHRSHVRSIERPDGEAPGLSRAEHDVAWSEVAESVSS